MLLIDEIDRADEEFEAFLLEVLSDFQITIPELGTIEAKQRPYVILTSNRTRELHDALKRRCLFHWIGHPSLEREIEIVKLRVPGVPERLAAEAAAFVAELRLLDLQKPPGLAETIDWAQALTALGQQELDVENVETTLGSVLKYHEDLLSVRDETLAGLVASARARLAPSSGTSSRSAACCARPGSRSGRDASSDALKGLDAVELARQDDVYWTLRQTLVSRREDVDAFDRAFHAWFLGAAVQPPAATKPPPSARRAPQGSRRPARARSSTAARRGSAPGARTSCCARRTSPSMTPEEFARAKRLIQAIAVARPQRRTRRLRRDSKGRALDVRGLVRASLATGGDPVERAFRSRKAAPRKLVLILDVSGSMEAYARALLLYLHAARGSGRGVETFAFGTRLTRLTPELGARNPETAFEAAAARVQDWSGGTRIGASLKAYNDEWGRRALTRGAVVVILSDGCERGDAELAGREMERLARQAFAVVWVNPLKGHADYEPLAGGMRAALPYVDRFLAGHDVASLESLGSVLGGIERRHAA